jgi:hypothetical protein
MPDLSDDLFLGRTADEMGDSTQIEVNEDLLYFHDQKTLIEAISHPMSKYEIKTLFSRVGDNNEFYLVILKEIGKVYRLENLKLFLSPSFLVSDPSDPSKEINTPNNVRLLYYNLKVTIPVLIREKKFTLSLERQDFENIIRTEKGISQLFIWAISFLDKENWNKFKKEIFRQNSLPLPE